jgi:hypothetical protein
MTDATHIPAAERANRYRELARAALSEADIAHDSMRRHYRVIAEQLQRLADAAEAGPPAK